MEGWVRRRSLDWRSSVVLWREEGNIRTTWKAGSADDHWLGWRSSGALWREEGTLELHGKLGPQTITGLTIVWRSVEREGNIRTTWKAGSADDHWTDDRLALCGERRKTLELHGRLGPQTITGLTIVWRSVEREKETLELHGRLGPQTITWLTIVWRSVERGGKH